MRVKIYILERNGIPYYVGKTIQSLQERLYTHGKNRKNDFILEIDDVDESEWEFWESHYIWLFRSWGFVLENKNFGGGGRESGWISTPERNNKIKQNRKGKGLGPNPKISEKNKGKLKPFSENHIKNMKTAKRKQAKPGYRHVDTRTNVQHILVLKHAQTDKSYKLARTGYKRLRVSYPNRSLELVKLIL